MLLVYFRAESILEADTKELRRKIWCCLCTSWGERMGLTAKSLDGGYGSPP